MCIAIANFKGKPLSDEQLSNCWSNNPDGAGIMYKEDGILKVYKQLHHLDRFIKKYKEVINLSNCLVHFRVVSRGTKNLSNIHPFMVNKDLGFIHNGTIHSMPNDPELSDTQLLNTGILKNLPKGFTENDATMVLLEEFVGLSKLVFMDKNEVFTIINEDKGDYCEAGNWYSNNSWKQQSNYMWKGNTKVYKSSGGCNIQPKSSSKSSYTKSTTTVSKGLAKVPMVPSVDPIPDAIKYPDTDDEYYADEYAKDEYDRWWLDQEIDKSLDDSLGNNDEPLPHEKRWAEYITELCSILDQVPDETYLTKDTKLILGAQVMYNRKDVVVLGSARSAILSLNEDLNFNILEEAAVHIYEKEAF